MTKTLIITLSAVILCVITANRLLAQGMGVNDNGAQPHPSSMLDVTSSTKGVLIPRMTTNEQLNISTPATGLLIYNTDSANFWFFDGAVWRSICNCNIITGVKSHCDSLSCGDIIDSRDGQVYKTITIGTQCWMRENLNVGSMINAGVTQTNNMIIEKYCRNDSIEYCDGTGGKPKLGGFYQWDELMEHTTVPKIKGICPTGWHVPDDIEWQTLEIALGMCSGAAPGCSGSPNVRGTDEGNQLKLAADCYTSGGYTNCGTSCFDAILGGDNLGSGYVNYGVRTLFYTSSLYNASQSYCRWVDINNSTITSPNSYNHTRGFNLRCVKD